jgi:hypothetical protein
VLAGNPTTGEVIPIDSLHAQRDGAGTASLRTHGGKAFLAGSDQVAERCATLLKISTRWSGLAGRQW